MAIEVPQNEEISGGGREGIGSESEDVYNEAISNAMRLDRFDKIMQSLHFNANVIIDKRDKYAKLRPLLQHLQKKFMLHYVPSLSI